MKIWHIFFVFLPPRYQSHFHCFWDRRISWKILQLSYCFYFLWITFPMVFIYFFIISTYLVLGGVYALLQTVVKTLITHIARKPSSNVFFSCNPPKFSKLFIHTLFLPLFPTLTFFYTTKEVSCQQNSVEYMSYPH